MDNIFNFTNTVKVNFRLDLFLFYSLNEQSNYKISRTNISNIITSDGVKVNGETIKKSSYLLKINDKIIFTLKENKTATEVIESNIKLDIIFENNNLLIINKPKNLSIHEGAGKREFTLVDALKSHLTQQQLSNVRGFEKAGILHRLDKDTTGLLIVAKNNQIHYLLGEMFKNREIEKKYLSICYGVPMPFNGVIENYIKRDEKDISKMTIDTENLSKKSKLAITKYQVLKVFFNGAFSLVETNLLTGRTHQIRLHLSSIKKPIVGDSKYDNIQYRYYKGLQDANITKSLIAKTKNIKTQMLHSYSLKFTEPITKEQIDIQHYPNFLDFENIIK